LLGPVLAYMFGRVDVIGALLYLVPALVALNVFGKRAEKANQARIQSLRAGSGDPPGGTPPR
jgi:hypothetical protein